MAHPVFNGMSLYFPIECIHLIFGYKSLALSLFLYPSSIVLNASPYPFAIIFMFLVFMTVD